MNVAVDVNVIIRVIAMFHIVVKQCNNSSIHKILENLPWGSSLDGFFFLPLVGLLLARFSGDLLAPLGDFFDFLTGLLLEGSSSSWLLQCVEGHFKPKFFGSKFFC